jgi:cardiolipin synthase
VSQTIRNFGQRTQCVAGIHDKSARGALSTQRLAAIRSKLSRSAGELDILQHHIAVEQAIVGSPLTAGNRVPA